VVGFLFPRGCVSRSVLSAANNKNYKDKDQEADNQCYDWGITSSCCVLLNNMMLEDIKFVQLLHQSSAGKMLTKQHYGRFGLVTPRILVLSWPLCALSFEQGFMAQTIRKTY